MKNRLWILPVLACLLWQCGSKTKSSQTDSEKSVNQEQITLDSPEIVGVNKEAMALHAPTSDSQNSNELSQFFQYSDQQMLINAFGKDNVKDEEIVLEEGTVRKSSSILFANQDDELRIIWEEKGLTIVCGKAQGRWEHQGIKCGMTLAELSEKIGTPIFFYGFGWDYGGTVDINNGALAALNTDITVTATDELMQKNSFMGEQLISSAKLSEKQQEMITVSALQVKATKASQESANPSVSNSLVSKAELMNMMLMGVEPNWVLKFTINQMELTPNIDEEVILIKYEQIIRNGEHILIKGKYGETQYDIDIKEEECNDGMSDMIYPYRASIKSSEGTNWDGCGQIKQARFATNYIDLPDEHKELFKTLLQSDNVEIFGRKELDMMKHFLNESVLANRDDYEPGNNPYSANIESKYFWYVYNALPDFVDKQERHRGYYEGSSDVPLTAKLFAYSIYRIDRSPENIKALFRYIKPRLKDWLKESVFNHYRLDGTINSLLSAYEIVKKAPNYKQRLNDCYAVVDTLQGRLEFDGTTEKYIPGTGAYGFDHYELGRYVSRHLTIDRPKSNDDYNYENEVIPHVSFWMRRCHEGNMDEVYNILKEVKAIYSGISE